MKRVPIGAVRLLNVAKACRQTRHPFADYIEGFVQQKWGVRRADLKKPKRSRAKPKLPAQVTREIEMLGVVMDKVRELTTA